MLLLETLLLDAIVNLILIATLNYVQIANVHRLKAVFLTHILVQLMQIAAPTLAAQVLQTNQLYACQTVQVPKLKDNMKTLVLVLITLNVLQTSVKKALVHHHVLSLIQTWTIQMDVIVVLALNALLVYALIMHVSLLALEIALMH